MSFRTILMLVTTVMIGAAGQPVLGQEGNLLRNGGFERAAGDSAPAEWQRLLISGDNRVMVDASRPYRGHHSLMIARPMPNNSATAVEQAVTLEASESYSLRFRAYASGLDLGANGWGVFAAVMDQDESIEDSGTVLPLGSEITGGEGWTKQELGPFEVEESGEKRIVLGIRGATGTVWLDQVSLHPASSRMYANDEHVRKRLSKDLETVREAAREAGDTAIEQEVEQLAARVEAVETLPTAFDRTQGPPYFPLHREIYQLMARLHAADHPGEAIVARPVPAMARTPALAYPAPAQHSQQPVVRGVREDTQQFVVALTNTTQQPRQVRVRLGERNIGALPIASYRWRQVIPVERWNHQMIDDALPLMPEYFVADQSSLGWAVITIPPGATRQAWLELRLADRPADEIGVVEVSWDGGSASVPVRFKVHDLAFPSDWPIDTFSYAYLNAHSLVKDRVRQASTDLDAHHQNMMKFHQWTQSLPEPVFSDEGKLLVEQMDWSEIDAALAYSHGFERYILQLRRHILDYGGGLSRLGGGEELEVGGTEWRRRVEAWVRALIAGFEERGIDRSRLLFEALDEPGVSEIDVVIALGQVLDAIDPDLLLYSNVRNTMTADGVHRMCQVLDFVTISEGHWRKQAYFDAVEGTDTTLWGYDVNGRGISPRAIRAIFIHAFNLGMQGMSFWNYSAPGKIRTDNGNYPVDAWDSFAYGGDTRIWSVVYNGDPRELIPSKRWEAWREGVEDYTLLWMLRQAVSEREREDAGSSATLATARKLLSAYEGVGRSERETAVEELRPRLLQTLEALDDP